MEETIAKVRFINVRSTECFSLIFIFNRGARIDFAFPF